MPEIILPPGIERSPEKLFLKDLNLAFLEADLLKIEQIIHEDIRWEWAGEWVIEGKGDFMRKYREMSGPEAQRLEIRSLLIEGNRGAAEGIITMPDGDRYSFADFYEFTTVNSIQVSGMTSYVVEIP